MAVMYWNKAIMHEQLKEYKKALKVLKKAKINTYNNYFMRNLKEEQIRVKKKMKKN